MGIVDISHGVNESVEISMIERERTSFVLNEAKNVGDAESIGEAF